MTYYFLFQSFHNLLIYILQSLICYVNIYCLLQILVEHFVIIFISSNMRQEDKSLYLVLINMNYSIHFHSNLSMSSSTSGLPI